jgi:hypothetical protein
MSTSDHLGTYLNDHLGGANAGVQMARQLCEGIAGEPGAAALGPIASEIEEDMETLRGLMASLGVTRHPIKEAVGRAAETAHRLGVATLRTGSPALTRMLQAESLALGVEGKLRLWQALTAVVPAFPKLAAADLPALAERARDQLRRLETVRLDAARHAFTAVD